MSREWTKIKDYQEILFDFYNGIARISINRFLRVKAGDLYYI